ncbi:MAG TPA: MmgE/PrpD family protein [Burkholderiales bacterium]|nr:MmgE/PrpD family protein [Burkholderiales bacterium]
MSNADKTLTQQVAQFVASRTYDDIPPAVRERAKLVMLDAIGTAFAASRYPFASVALSALSSLGSGDSTVIGMDANLALRDAVVMNGILVHGLDYDDTYLPGSVHLSASGVPTVLAMGPHTRSTGAEMLTATVLGLEISARIAAAAKGGFVNAGFHATGIAGAFGSTVAAGRLMKLDAAQHALAQGVALSVTSSTLQPLQEGSWTKRLHPGWAGASGITAAAFARAGYVGPTQAYEGRFGLYTCFLGEHAAGAQPGMVVEGLGDTWEFTRTSIKLFPACHQLHAFMNAAITLSKDQPFNADNVASVRSLICDAAVPLVCEPQASKLKPASSYSAQFSLPYAVACALMRGKFGLNEIEAPSYTDTEVLRLANKVSYEIDPNPGFPKSRSGEIIVKMMDGRELRCRDNILPDEPASAESIVEKFTQNTASILSPAQARQIHHAVLGLDKLSDTGAFVRSLGISKTSAKPAVASVTA